MDVFKFIKANRYFYSLFYNWFDSSGQMAPHGRRWIYLPGVKCRTGSPSHTEDLCSAAHVSGQGALGKRLLGPTPSIAQPITHNSSLSPSSGASESRSVIRCQNILTRQGSISKVVARSYCAGKSCRNDIPR